ncbi:MAG: serine hydrolase [Nostocaceae cyanobacterium]|nr:serine hydrolase [Nostocaceae cyanobacterium]
MPKHNFRKLHDSRQQFVTKSPQIPMQYFQFYGLIALVAMIIVGAFGVGTLVAENTNNQNSPTQTNTNSQTSAVASRKPNTISTPITNSQPILQAEISENTGEFIYNVSTVPNLKESEKLGKIVADLVKYAKKNNLPTKKLSITLIDLNQNTIANYQQDTARYPASVVKLFWMIALNAQIQRGLIPFDSSINKDLNDMIIKSDNDAASRIVDRITGTQSYAKNLDNEQLKTWKNNREKLNNFFQKAGYKNINISQKTFPIEYLNIQEPQGADLQIRGNSNNPQRNRITTYQAARLMYEIVSAQAVAPGYLEQNLGLLKRDINPAVWRKQPPNPIDFNPVESFLGESLPANKITFFASKAGWTSFSRQEVAFVNVNSAKNRYILAIFGDDAAYARSKKVFPQMSRIVFDRITNSKL